MARIPAPLIPASAEALLRYQVVSAVLAMVVSGQVRADAVRAVAALPWLDLNRRQRRVSTRSIYRWLKAWTNAGIAGLEPRSRKRCEASEVLPEAFIDFLRLEHGRDLEASIPEIIRRARQLGILGPGQRVDRTTVWRAARRMGLAFKRHKKGRGRDARRFRHAHRMQLVMTDGKHFRAGHRRLRRVVLIFIDNATRYGLNAVVGTSETAALFLRGLFETVLRHGLMDVLYLDRGSGFTANDTVAVVQKLDALLVHGEAGYPSSRGEVERFNRTASAQLLRGWDRQPAIDPACGALELRAKHFLREVYNHTVHEALDGQTPHQRWSADPRALRLPADPELLRSKFLVEDTRDVSNDHIISVDSVLYEIPRGHAGTTIRFWRQVLDGQLYVLHEERVVRIHPVDLEFNAVSSRARRRPVDDPTPTPPVPSAADLAFQRDFGPVTGPDGGFTDNQDTP